MPDPVNTIRIEYSDHELKCIVHTTPGPPEDITSVFDSVTGKTGVGAMWTQITLKKQTAEGRGLETTISFVPSRKELVFEVEPSVAGQLLAFFHG